MIEVDKERFPLQPARGKNEKYPFKVMQVGDSFTVPANRVNAARTAAHLHGKKLGWRFTCRKIGEIARIWRTA